MTDHSPCQAMVRTFAAFSYESIAETKENDSKSDRDLVIKLRLAAAEHYREAAAILPKPAPGLSDTPTLRWSATSTQSSNMSYELLDRPCLDQDESLTLESNLMELAQDVRNHMKWNKDMLEKAEKMENETAELGQPSGRRFTRRKRSTSTA